MTPSKLQYDVDADLAARGAAAAATADPVVRRAQAAARRAIVQAVVFAGIGFAGLLAVHAPPELIAGYGFALVAGVMVGQWPTAGRLRRAIAKQTRKLADDPAHAVALGQRTVVFGRTTVTVQVPHARHEFALGLVATVRATPDFLVLIFPGPTPFAVPRTAFADDFAYERFCEDVTELVRAAGGGP